MNKHEQARSLYEGGGYSLAEISRKLELNANTVKTWKRREGWSKPGEETKPRGSKYEHGKNPNTLKSLDESRTVIQPGQKIATKHGLYSDHSDDDGYDKFYNQAKELPAAECAKNVFAKAYANLMVTLETIDTTNPAYLEPIARVATMVGNLAEKPSKIEHNELSNKLDSYKVTQIDRMVNGDDDPHIQMLEAYIEAVQLDAQRDSGYDEYEIKIQNLESEINSLKSKLDEAGIDYE